MIHNYCIVVELKSVLEKNMKRCILNKIIRSIYFFRLIIHQFSIFNLFSFAYSIHRSSSLSCVKNRVSNCFSNALHLCHVEKSCSQGCDSILSTDKRFRRLTCSKALIRSTAASVVSFHRLFGNMNSAFSIWSLMSVNEKFEF